MAQEKNSWQTDWTKCCLCQTETSERLISPHLNPTKRCDDGYSLLGRNIPIFHSINQLPIKFDLARLDDGSGIEQTLRTSKAQYHESCKILFNNTKLQRAEKRSTPVSDKSENSCRSKVPRKSLFIELSKCFLCEEESDDLHEAMTMQLNKRVNECAVTLSDGKLLAKLSSGDIVAQELKYHKTCLVGLYNREKAYLKAQEQTRSEGLGQDTEYHIAFSELVTYINEMKNASENSDPVIFRLQELCALYKERLHQLGIDSPDVHCTRLKEQLLLHIPELQAHRDGRYVLLAFKKDVGSLLGKANKYGDAIHLAKAAEMIRREMLQHKQPDYSTGDESLEQSVPSSLLQFVSMIEHGADIKSQLLHGASKSDLALAQLLQYSCFASIKRESNVHRHSKERETPFAVYVGLYVFSKTRKRQLVEMLSENGLSISYDRVLELSAQLGDAVIDQYIEDGVVCPPVLRKKLFTTSAVDNIDHNPSSTTAQTSFHGNSISLFQHPDLEESGEERQHLKPNSDLRVKKVRELPEAYTNVPPAHISKAPLPPDGHSHSYPAPEAISNHMKEEFCWLEEVNLTETIDDKVSITWSSFHAARKRNRLFEVSISVLLPLLRDPAHSVATLKHSMDKIRETVTFLNPGQTPVITADQPLYALMKQIQWTWPDYDEKKFVIMFGGLHIELAALRSVGTLLEGSGWTSAINEAGIASSGTAESFLTASSITRTRFAHQVTACALYKLMKEAYQKYCTDADNDTRQTFDEWCDSQLQRSPQFQFWHMVLDMELAIFMLIRSFREGDFDLYRDTLSKLIPYFFANNNVNYARWLPVHLRDMLSLEEQHSEVAHEFSKGKFVVHKTKRDFSAIPIDQAHEQNNAVIKGDGGAIGLTEDSGALLRWMVAGPEVSRLVAGYEALSGKRDSAIVRKHHEDIKSAQKSFLQKVESLVAVTKEMGNPFQEDSEDLLVLDTKDIADPVLAGLVGTHHRKGQEKFQSFMEGLNSGEECLFYKPIKKNKVSFFRSEQLSKSTSKEKTLKDSCQLFSRLFISCQTRKCDLQEFFKHENQPYPAALSDGGDLHACQKSQLTDILQSHVDLPESAPEGDCIIIDGAALINAIPPRTSKTFDDYVNEDILPKIQSFGSKYDRVDLIFDVYKTSSLKSGTRKKRGKGVRRRVTGTTRTPPNWRSFLRDDENKTELFRFIAEKLCTAVTRCTLIVTKDDLAMTNGTTDLNDVSPCSHEEADTRIFVHARHAAICGSKSIIIKANDTDVVVLAVSALANLKALGLEKVWIAYGQGGHVRWIPIHEIALEVGQEKASGITYFHAFTGCDTVSAFLGKGKKSAWLAWTVFDEVSETFRTLSNRPTEVTTLDMQKLEKFVVLMYDRSSALNGVDEERLELFARKQRSYDAIPPTSAALKEHAKRAAYQAGIIWGQVTDPNPDYDSPANWGWDQDGDTWKIKWTTLPPISASCQELIKCSCKKGCKQRCKCFRSGLTCTALCSCDCEL